MSEEGSSGGGGGWKGLVGAVVGAVAIVVAALIAKGTGALDIAVSPGPTPTVTITPKAAATVTVTVPPALTAPGPVTLPNCPVNQGCKAWNLVVRLTPNNGQTGITLDTGSVGLNSNGDMQYGKSTDGTIELIGLYASAYSTAVSAQNPGKETCQNSTTSDPDPDPIANFHKGLFFCVATGGSPGISLVEETEPLASNDVLYLRELYWPNSVSG
jgi:hypothetical protein